MKNNKFNATKNEEYDSLLEKRIAEWSDKMGIHLERNTESFTYLDSFETHSCMLVVPKNFRKPCKKASEPSVRVKKKISKRSYTPDFSYRLNDGTMLYIEAKGMELPDWKIRRDLIIKRFEEEGRRCTLAVIKTKRQLFDLYSGLGLINSLIQESTDEET